MKPRMSDVIEHQSKCVTWIMQSMRSPCCYPLDTEPTSDAEILALLDLKDRTYDSEDEKIACEKEEIEGFKDLKTDLEKKYVLGNLILDKVGALIILDKEPEPWLIDEGFKVGDSFIFMSEIAQMPGHITVCSVQSLNKPPKMLTCVHDWNFFLARPMDT